LSMTGFLPPLVWLAALMFIWSEGKSERGVRLAGADGLLILCPRCGYNMGPQTQSRCPECGALFTIAGLLAAQANQRLQLEEFLMRDHLPSPRPKKSPVAAAVTEAQSP
jgi:hypothetical protein